MIEILAIIAAFLWSFVNIIDKHVLSEELKDPITSTAIYCISIFVLFSIVAFIFGEIKFGFESIISIIAGFVYGLAIIFYYKAFKTEEVSRVVPLTMTTPLFVLLFSTFIFGEVFTPLRYAGLFLLIIGCILISIKKSKTKTNLSTAFGIAILAALLFALRNILLKFSAKISILSMLFWIAIGGLLFSIVLFAFHHPHIKSKVKIKGIEHLMLAATISAVAFFIFTIAVANSYVSIVTALASTQVLFVFVIATLLSKFKPKIIREELKGTTIEIKILATIIILLGLFMLI